MTTELLNTLFVQTQGSYLHLDNGTLRVEAEKETKLRVPLHHLGSIVVFGNVLISPFLLAQCTEEGRSIVWLSRQGGFQGRLQAGVSGNVLLRRAQHEAFENAEMSLHLAMRFVSGKLRNTQTILQKAARDSPEVADILSTAVDRIEQGRRNLKDATSIETVRGIEGNAAAVYFDVFPCLLRVDGFEFTVRSKRPPRDPVNAALSFVYTMVTSLCEAALESVGLDPQVGFLHVLRPGRPALALDLVEEFRAWFADRLVLTLINRQQLRQEHFEFRPGGAVYLNDSGRRLVIEAYQQKKQETIQHPGFKVPLPIGLIPFVQARLLARFLRGDILTYPPFRVR
jgi:CRISPR-associated protein Cas1